MWPGAASDLETATRIARAMVTRFGMTDKARHPSLSISLFLLLSPSLSFIRSFVSLLPGRQVGPVAHADKDEPASPATQAVIDEEIKRLLKVPEIVMTLFFLSFLYSIFHTLHTIYDPYFIPRSTSFIFHTTFSMIHIPYFIPHFLSLSSQESRERAVNMLKQYSVEHKHLAEALLKYETLSVEEIKVVISGKPLDRKI